MGHVPAACRLCPARISLCASLCALSNLVRYCAMMCWSSAIWTDVPFMGEPHGRRSCNLPAWDCTALPSLPARRMLCVVCPCGTIHTRNVRPMARLVRVRLHNVGSCCVKTMIELTRATLYRPSWAVGPCEWSPVWRTIVIVGRG